MSIFETGPMNTSIEQDKKRQLETMNLNIKLKLKQCFDQGIQPKNALIKYLNKEEEVNKKFGDLSEIYNDVSNLPDYKLTEPENLALATEDVYRILSKVVDLKFSNPEELRIQGEMQKQKHEKWKNAGIFAYEDGEHNELILHVPPTSESPKNRQILESLKLVADVVAKNPDINAVYGESLLLEHGLAKRLGFDVKPGLTPGSNPRFTMPRKEFLERFAK